MPSAALGIDVARHHYSVNSSLDSLCHCSCTTVGVREEITITLPPPPSSIRCVLTTDLYAWKVNKVNYWIQFINHTITESSKKDNKTST